MKITFVMAGGFGLSGGDRVVATYAEELRQRGHEVLVISPDPFVPTFKAQVRSMLKGKGWIPTQRSRPSHFDNTTVARILLDCYRPVVDSDIPDADVVIATWWETAEWVAKLSPAKGAKAYFVQGYEVFDHTPKDRVEATYSLPLHKITISNWLLNLLDQRFGQKDVTLVQNSVDTEMFQSPARGKQAVPTVGFVYSLLPCKGIDITLKACELAAQRIPNLRFIAFGEAISPDLPLPAGTEYVQRPSQETLHQFYGQCDAWLFGSREEGFGLPILEAMACRTPVIGCPAGAAPELLAQGGGMLLKPEDAAGMAAAIEKICQMPEAEWQQISDAAYATATNYTLDDAVDLFEAALIKTVEQSTQTEYTSPHRVATV